MKLKLKGRDFYHDFRIWKCSVGIRRGSAAAAAAHTFEFLRSA